MDNSKEMKVKLNPRGWEIYREKNGFADSNIDSEGYSYFSYDYYESLFFPLLSHDYADEIINNRKPIKKASIKYCPNCGCDVSHKNLGDGNHWECDKCDELVEAYILDKRINGVTIISN